MREECISDFCLNVFRSSARAKGSIEGARVELPEFAISIEMRNMRDCSLEIISGIGLFQVRLQRGSWLSDGLAVLAYATLGSLVRRED